MKQKNQDGIDNLQGLNEKLDRSSLPSIINKSLVDERATFLSWSDSISCKTDKNLKMTKSDTISKLLVSSHKNENQEEWNVLDYYANLLEKNMHQCHI